MESLSEQCWTGRHLALVCSVGVVGLLVWVIGLPLGTGLVLREKAALLQQRAVKARLGFLYSGFTQRAYFWEVVVMTRKEAVAAIGTFLVSYGTTVQALLLLVLLGTSLLVQLRFRPYSTPFLNGLEAGSLGALLVSVLAGLFFLGDRDPSSPFFRPGTDFALSEPVRWILFLLMLLVNSTFFLKLLAHLLRHLRTMLRDRHPQFYLACCLCFSRRLLEAEKQEHRHEKQSQTVLEQLESVIAGNKFPITSRT